MKPTPKVTKKMKRKKSQRMQKPLQAEQTQNKKTENTAAPSF